MHAVWKKCTKSHQWWHKSTFNRLLKDKLHEFFKTVCEILSSSSLMETISQYWLFGSYGFLNWFLFCSGALHYAIACDVTEIELLKNMTTQISSAFLFKILTIKEEIFKVLWGMFELHFCNIKVIIQWTQSNFLLLWRFIKLFNGKELQILYLHMLQ